MENQILKHRLAVQGNIEKAFDVDFEKGRTGVYSDNAENRRLHRVGQQYGHKKEQEQTAGDDKGGKKEEPTDHAKHASAASDEALKRAAADENADEKVRNAAKEELKNRGEGGEEKKEETTSEKLKRRYGVEDIDKLPHDWFYYGNTNSYLDAKTPKEKNKALNSIIVGYEKFDAEFFKPLIQEWSESENFTEEERKDLKDALDKLNSVTPNSKKSITSKDVKSRIKDCMESEWGEPETRQDKKLMKDVKDAAQNFLDKNKDLRITPDELQAIVEGAVNTEDEYEHLTKLEGFKELDEAIEKYIDKD